MLTTAQTKNTVGILSMEKQNSFRYQISFENVTDEKRY